jgi:hypothetical protein
VAAASHGDEKIALARETDGGPDVGGAGAAREPLKPGTYALSLRARVTNPDQPQTGVNYT